MSEPITALLDRARAGGVFSGAAWSCGTADGVRSCGVVGTVSWDGPAVTPDTWWDLASITKPVVALAVMSLVESGELCLDDPVAGYLSDWADTDKAAVTVRQLLTHTAGLPGQVPFYRWCATRAELYAALRETPLRFPPGGGVEYSSAGFVVLGLIAEAASGRPLDRLVEERVCAPVQLARTGFGVPAGDRHRAAAAERCPWRGELVQGTVHDENAVVLGGVAGHAGLFAPLADVQRLAQELCRIDGGRRGVLSPATLAVMTAVATDGLSLRRCLGWQGRDTYGCPAGDLIGSRAYGHTGFTGTSLWIDPDRGSFAVLLTNRVHPTRAERGFAAVRARFHNVAAALVG